MSEARFIRSSELLFRRTSTEVLVSSAGQVGVDALSGSAVRVWDILAEPRTVGAIVDELATFYDAPRVQIAPQVQTLLKELLDRGWAIEASGG